jgi:hypothetical protein
MRAPFLKRTQKLRPPSSSYINRRNFGFDGDIAGPIPPGILSVVAAIGYERIKQSVRLELFVQLFQRALLFWRGAG